MRKKIGFVILVVFFTVVFLLVVGLGAKRVPWDGERFVLTEEELRDGIWLLQMPVKDSGSGPDIRRIDLKAPKQMPVCLRVPEDCIETLYVNGQKVTGQDILVHTIVILPEGYGKYTIEMQLPTARFRDMAQNNIYVGTRDRILNSERQAQWKKGMSGGFFFFSALFALSLFVWKKSESYLIFYAIHAMVVLILGTKGVAATVGFSFFPRGSTVYQQLLSVRGVSCIWQNIYILMIAWIHARLYRAFIDDSIGEATYMRYLWKIFLVLTVISVLLGPAIDMLFVLYFFYFCVYLCEGYILLHNRSIMEQKIFQYVLLAAWCTSFLFWLLRVAHNFGFWQYPYNINNDIALCYTVGFLICINGKFSLKFVQADRLQKETAEMNDHLESLVEKRTQELKESYKKLEQVQEAKNQFVSNLIHNLKTPLFSVQGYGELIEEELEQDVDKAKEHFGVLRRNIDYVQGIIRQLSFYNRLEDGRIVFHRIPFEWNSMMKKSLDGLEIQKKEKNIFIKVESNQKRIIYEGDELYLQQAMQCILDNGIRHSDAGGQIVVASHVDTGGITVRIQDFGEGMDEEVCSHIFERGYSYHTNGEKSSGLGLNIVKLIVEAHQGTIGVESRPGEGSVFTIYIPFRELTGEEDMI